MTAPADPLVVTLQLDDAGARFFEAARQQHFPADRNQIPAHVSLFHALPGEHLDEVSAGLEAVAVRFDPWLTAQDSQALRPHVTVQNTVDADTARQAHAALEAAFEPFETVATGLELWWYRGGPWAPADVVPFAGAA